MLMTRSSGSINVDTLCRGSPGGPALRESWLKGGEARKVEEAWQSHLYSLGELMRCGEERIMNSHSHHETLIQR